MLNLLSYYLIATGQPLSEFLPKLTDDITLAMEVFAAYAELLLRWVFAIVL